MRVYQVWMSDQDGNLLSWHRNKRDADRQRAEWRRDYADDDAEPRVYPIDIPTHKAGLVDWLNQNMSRANG